MEKKYKSETYFHPWNPENDCVNDSIKCLRKTKSLEPGVSHAARASVEPPSMPAFPHSTPPLPPRPQGASSPWTLP